METGMIWLFGIMFLIFLLGVFAVGEAIKVMAAESNKKKSVAAASFQEAGRLAS